jgi:hypothetical protein
MVARLAASCLDRETKEVSAAKDSPFHQNQVARADRNRLSQLSPLAGQLGLRRIDCVRCLAADLRIPGYGAAEITRCELRSVALASAEKGPGNAEASPGAASPAGRMGNAQSAVPAPSFHEPPRGEPVRVIPVAVVRIHSAHSPPNRKVPFRSVALPPAAKCRG